METSLLNKELLSLILPEGILSYFDLSDLEKSEGKIVISLREKSIPPKELEGEEIQSRGFHGSRLVEDFPIRGNVVHLKIYRRRWSVKGSDHKVSRNWSLVAEGTRMTKEFADFLKELA